MTDSANGGKQESGDQCDAEDVKESHPRIRDQEKNQGAGAEEQPSHYQCAFIV